MSTQPADTEARPERRTGGGGGGGNVAQVVASLSRSAATGHTNEDDNNNNSSSSSSNNNNHNHNNGNAGDNQKMREVVAAAAAKQRAVQLTGEQSTLKTTNSELIKSGGHNDARRQQQQQSSNMGNSAARFQGSDAGSSATLESAGLQVEVGSSGAAERDQAKHETATATCGSVAEAARPLDQADGDADPRRDNVADGGLRRQDRPPGVSSAARARSEREQVAAPAQQLDELKRRPSQDSRGDDADQQLVNLDERQRAQKCDDANGSAKHLQASSQSSSSSAPPPETTTTSTNEAISNNKHLFNESNHILGPEGERNPPALNQTTSAAATATTTSTSHKDGKISLDQIEGQHDQQLGLDSPIDSAQNQFAFKPASPKRLSFLQSLLLRRWPCLPLAICIMSSLLFGILLSGLTIYLMHGVDGGQCSELNRLVSAKSGIGGLASVGGATSAAVNSPDGSQHNLRRQPHLPELGSSLLPHELLVGSGDSPPPASNEAADSNELSHRHAPALSAATAPAATTTTTAAASQPQAFQRLPNSVVPQHYELFIWPHIAEPTFHFNGSVDIYLVCKEPTDNITLHTLDLTLNETSLRVFGLGPAGKQQQAAVVPAGAAVQLDGSRLSAASSPRVVRMSQDKQLQYSIVHLDSKLEAGHSYLLRVDFVGFLNDDLAGFYKIKYERPNSTEITWIAATQFQATDARRAFPCFDEPHYKATFGIRLRHWKNMTALSNMQIVATEESPDGLWITDTFAKSQRMSTYLVAFAVTNFESRTNGNITVWTRPGLVHTADYALSIAGKILRYYEDYFGIAYPLPKMDMIALPDFNAGAMENWGLITYRETAMLYDEKTSSVANKQRVAVVVAHELAHQWFGNLVTPKWWDDLWLNEGFASFVEYIGVDHVEPKWRMLDQFVVDEMQDVLELDGLSSSHQISIPVNNPDEISEIFDHISYSKGASIIRMMNHFLTERVFSAGLQRYLKALKYDNAEQSDLWAHLMEAQRMFSKLAPSTNSTANTSSNTASEFEPIDVSKVMNSWTLQTGYPLVTLTRDYAKNTASLEQLRYQPYKLRELPQNGSTESATTTAAAAADQRWEIPITYTWKSEQNWTPVTRLWMHQNQSGAVALSARQMPQASSEWMIVNVQQVGYYRVNYDLHNWNLLIEQLRHDHSKVATANRAQLLDDLFELAKSSQLDYKLAMEATRYLKAEREYLPWESILQSFGYIDEMLLRTPIYGDWQDYFAQLLAPHYERYKDADWTWPKPAVAAAAANETTLDLENDVLEQYNQVNAVSWACALNNQHCIQKAIAVFKRYKATGVNNIKPAFRHRAYCTGIEYGTKEDWDFLWRVYEKEQAPSERDRILRALGCSRELWILSRYLEWTFSKTKPIRRQDGAFVFRLVAKNKHGREIAFNFMRERWATIKEYYGKSTFSLGSLIKSVATSMNSQLELDQLKVFYESIKGDVGTGKRSFQIAIEEVESNVSWRTKNYKILEEWLQKQKLGTGAKPNPLAQSQ